RIETALATAADRLKWDGAAALQRMGAYEPEPEWLLTVVRDLRAEHLLFAEARSRSEPQVSGLIDFHAARLDSPACDLGRLLASWCAGPPQPAVVRETVHAYAAAREVGGGGRPLEASQLCERIELIAATGVLLGLDNWVCWVAQEQRRFPDWSAVADRLEWHLEALPASLCRLQSTPVSA
ncbi:MAG: phosphotransferase, partial [Planctomycetota bacterium]|nr:phosphotransferase [Planctomycetota bacterium]